MKKAVTVIAILIVLAILVCYDALRIRPFSYEEREKVTGKARLSQYAPEFEGQLYNGTTLQIKIIEINIKCLNQDGTERWTRKFRREKEIAPLSTESFSFQVMGAEGNPTLKWSISNIYGR